MKIPACLLTAYLSMACTTAGAQVIPLYDQNIPNSKPSQVEERIDVQPDGQRFIYSIVKPTLQVFLPPEKTASGTGVIICPGGGYAFASEDHEGVDVAKKLNQLGVAGFVLNYRMPSDEYMVNKEFGPLQDAQRAIQIVRENADKWHIKTLGIMGFSAGGHLASTAATHFDKAKIDGHGISLRPDFVVLIYPVISMTDIGHMGSRENLLGHNPSQEKIEEYSNELHVTAQTPPAFLVHAQDDDVVKIDNPMRFYEALTKNNVPGEMHLYAKGGHGFGMNNPTTQDAWFDRLREWLMANKWCGSYIF